MTNDGWIPREQPRVNIYYYYQFLLTSLCYNHNKFD